jgi:hypothetical protein
MTAPHDRADACDEFLGVKGFTEIIVGTGAQALDPFVPGVARRQDDDRHIVVAGPPMAQDIKTWAPGQAKVEHNGVIWLTVAEKFRINAVSSGIYRESDAFEIPAQVVRQMLIILNQQQAQYEATVTL